MTRINDNQRNYRTSVPSDSNSISIDANDSSSSNSQPLNAFERNNTSMGPQVVTSTNPSPVHTEPRPISDVLLGRRAKIVTPRQSQLMDEVVKNPRKALEQNYADSLFLLQDSVRKQISSQNSDVQSVLYELQLRVDQNEVGVDVDDPLPRPAFLATMLSTDPLLLDTAPFKAQKSALLGSYAAVANQYHELKETLSRLGMENLSQRVQSIALIEELIHNATTSAAQDPRPLAVVLFSKRDPMDQLQENSIADIAKSHRVVYKEVESDLDCIASLSRLTQEKPANLVLVGGTHSKEGVQLGSEGLLGLFGSEKAHLDTSDRRELSGANIQIAKGANIVFQVAGDTAFQKNVSPDFAKAFFDTFPQANVYAPQASGFADLRLDSEGTFHGVNYGGSKDPGESQWHIIQPYVFKSNHGE